MTPAAKSGVAPRDPARAPAWPTRLLASLAVVAAVAPLLASDAPLVLWDAHGLAFPVFAGFRAEDVAWLLGVPLLLLCRPWSRAPRSRLRIATSLVVFVAMLVFGALAPGRNLAVVDWAARARAPGASALFAPVRFGASTIDESAGSRLRPPFAVAGHPLGTDGAGRDVFARLLFGARTSRAVSVLAAMLATLVGVLAGGLSGLIGGRLDLAVSWLIQVFVCFPVLFTLIVLAAIFPTGVTLLVVLLGLTRWTGAARLVRGEALRLRDAEFVRAAALLGQRPLRIVLGHILPHALGPLLVQTAFNVAGAVLVESGLSFLGLGVTPPRASWGQMMAEGREHLGHATHLVVFPGLLLLALVSACLVLGDVLRGERERPFEEARR